MLIKPTQINGVWASHPLVFFFKIIRKLYTPYSLIYFMYLLFSTPQHIVVGRFKNMMKNQKRPKHNFKMYKFIKSYLITMSDFQN